MKYYQTMAQANTSRRLLYLAQLVAQIKYIQYSLAEFLSISLSTESLRINLFVKKMCGYQNYIENRVALCPLALRNSRRVCTQA